jgi:uncharacterized delta-60 repeat protein
MVVGGSSVRDAIRRSTFALARYAPDGSLDPSFASGGIRLTSFDLPSGISSIAIQADGKIVAAGSTGSDRRSYNFALARYDAQGVRDRSFSGDGKVVTSLGYDDYGTDVAIQPDGKIVLAGEATPNVMGVTRYKAS